MSDEELSATRRIYAGTSLSVADLPAEPFPLFEAWLAEDYAAYPKLSMIRREVLMNMGFNMGRAGIAKFKNMWAAINRYDYEQAAAEMLDSRWATQVGARAVELAGMMRDG